MREPRPRSGARRAVITGLGAVSGCGWGVGPLWEDLLAGRTAIRSFDRFDLAGHRTKLAAQAPPPPEAFRKRTRDGRRLTLADGFAIFAAAEALEAADLPCPLADERAGVFFGSCTGGFLESEGFYERLIRELRAGQITQLEAQQCSAPGEAVARLCRVEGPVETISSACASGGLALGAALDAVRGGDVDVAIAGGADTLCRLTYAGFNALRSVDEAPCRPFRADRMGLSLGEGAAVLIVEALDHARRRGAKPLVEISGWGSSCDAQHMTAPDPTGAGPARAITAALADSCMRPEDIGFIDAHGTGTPHNDASEHLALRAVFGERVADLPLTATKGVVGHLLGSAGAIEALATALCLVHGVVHPTPGAGPVDPTTPVRLVLGAPAPIPRDCAGLSTNLAFGGANAAVVLAPCNEPGR